MVGDRADTDGRFAVPLGGRFALVLSGVTRRADLPVRPAPDLVADDVAGLWPPCWPRSPERLAYPVSLVARAQHGTPQAAPRVTVSFTQMTRERAEGIVDELVREGQVRTEEYQRNVQELVDRSRESAERFNELVRAQVIRC